MKIGNRYSKDLLSLLLFIGAMQLLSGCQRRDLEDDLGTIAMIPFHINWSKSGLDLAQIHRATIRVFPHDGSPAYDFRLEENLSEVMMPLAIGIYSFVIYNETLETEDWKANIFKGENRYDDFIVASQDDDFKGLYTRVDKEKIRKSPDAMASWSIDKFEVTREMITYTTSMSSGNGADKAQFAPEVISRIEKQLQPLAIITPVSIVKKLNILLRVQNLASALKSSAAITGATEAVQMSTRLPIKQSVTHIFILNGRKYDNPDEPLHGTIGATILVFDITPYDKLKCELNVDFLLHDGTIVPTEVFNITKDLTQSSANININLGLDSGEHPEDHPIILPDVKIGSGNVGIDAWDEVVIPLR